MNLSVRELHIYVEQGLQRQGAYKKDYQFDAAVDIALTKAQNRIVKDRIVAKDGSDTFELNAKYTSDIEALIYLNYPISLIKTAKPFVVSGYLPYNFAYLLGDSSMVLEDCQPEFTTPSPFLSTLERCTILSFPNGSSSPYYKQVVMGVNAASQTINTVGFVSLEEKIYLVDYIVDAFVMMGVDAYWESYRGLFKPNSFILVSKILSNTYGLAIDGQAASQVIIDRAIDTYIALDTISTEVTNRDLKADLVRNAQQSTYQVTAPDSPISVMNQGSLSIYTNKRFIASKVFIDYIRKPKRISLALGQGCELSDTLHEEVADLAIQLLKKQIEDPSYSQEVQDNVDRIE